MKQTINVIGIASGIGANDIGCQGGPQAIKEACLTLLEKSYQHVNWMDVILPESMTEDKYEKIATICTEAAQLTYQSVKKNMFFLAVSGDHACAMGTWSGVAHALASNQKLGLIWIDAHMDSHTPETSESGNIHGMPVASLMGYGDHRLTQILDANPKLLPDHLCMIGVRSYEKGEEALLKRLGVKVYFIEEVNERGLDAVFEEAARYIQSKTDQYGLTVDLDAFDPSEIPGVGCPVKNGLHPEEFLNAIKKIKGHVDFLGLEIAEYNPFRDVNGLTERFFLELVSEIASIRD